MNWLLLLVGFWLAGFGAVSDRSTDLSEVRQFDGYRVYFAGQATAGFPLTDVVGEDFRDRSRMLWDFYYGDCSPSGDEGGCALPVQIQNYPICRRWPAAYARKPRLIDFRGAKATWGGGGTFEIYTGRTTIVTFGSRKRAKTVARQLREVSERRLGKLAPPVKGSLEGRLGCQTKPG